MKMTVFRNTKFGEIISLFSERKNSFFIHFANVLINEISLETLLTPHSCMYFFLKYYHSDVILFLFYCVLSLVLLLFLCLLPHQAQEQTHNHCNS